MSYLILVRHGQSRWNLSNRFTGWVDVTLSQKGVQEAMDCAKKLKHLTIHQGFTSHLERAQDTLNIILAEQEKGAIFLHPTDKKKKRFLFADNIARDEILVNATSLLNERYYGELQGMRKDVASKKFGKKKVLAWRRGYTDRPPGGESLKDVYGRVIPFFRKRITPLLKERKNIIIASHGNTMRAIIKYIENISSKDIPNLDFDWGEPIIYNFHNKEFQKLDGNLKFQRSVYWKAPKKSTI
ncbi:MAG: histidine phosphatase family protein [bacterium]|nr:histidine phosphatase family protein [bacterium]